MKPFISECVVKVGMPSGQAAELSKVLLAADYSGHYKSHLKSIEQLTLTNGNQRFISNELLSNFFFFLDLCVKDVSSEWATVMQFRH